MVPLYCVHETEDSTDIDVGAPAGDAGEDVAPSVSAGPLGVDVVVATVQGVPAHHHVADAHGGAALPIHRPGGTLRLRLLLARTAHSRVSLLEARLPLAGPQGAVHRGKSAGQAKQNNEGLQQPNKKGHYSGENIFVKKS